MPIRRLEKLAGEHGLTIIEKGKGHFQIKGGPCLVNYYPFSKRQTAYLAGTTMGQAHATPDVAIQLALGNEKVVRIPTRAKRRSQKRAKIRLWEKGCRHCEWCGCEFKTIDDATVDHRIPLGRGGLNNDNNKVLACSPCNNLKDNSMPSYDSMHELLKAKRLMD